MLPPPKGFSSNRKGQAKEASQSLLCTQEARAQRNEQIYPRADRRHGAQLGTEQESPNLFSSVFDLRSFSISNTTAFDEDNIHRENGSFINLSQGQWKKCSSSTL